MSFLLQNGLCYRGLSEEKSDQNQRQKLTEQRATGNAVRNGRAGHPFNETPLLRSLRGSPLIFIIGVLLGVVVGSVHMYARVILERSSERTNDERA